MINKINNLIFLVKYQICKKFQSFFTKKTKDKKTSEEKYQIVDYKLEPKDNYLTIQDIENDDRNIK